MSYSSDLEKALRELEAELDKGRTYLLGPAQKTPSDVQILKMATQRVKDLWVTGSVIRQHMLDWHADDYQGEGIGEHLRDLNKEIDSLRNSKEELLRREDTLRKVVKNLEAKGQDACGDLSEADKSIGDLKRLLQEEKDAHYQTDQKLRQAKLTISNSRVLTDQYNNEAQRLSENLMENHVKRNNFVDDMVGDLETVTQILQGIKRKTHRFGK